MSIAAHHSEAPSAVRVDLGAIFVSMKLSQSKWLITSLSPGSGEKLSKFTVANGDVGGMLARFAELQRKAQARTASASAVWTAALRRHTMLPSSPTWLTYVPLQISTSARPRRRERTVELEIHLNCWHRITREPPGAGNGSPGRGTTCINHGSNRQFALRVDRPANSRAAVNFVVSSMSVDNFTLGNPPLPV